MPFIVFTREKDYPLANARRSGWEKEKTVSVFLFRVCPHKNDNPAFLQISTLGTIVKNLRFWFAKAPFP